MVGRSWILGVPRDDGNKAKEGQRASTIRTRFEHEHDRAFVAMAEQKGATAAITKTVPRQRSDSGNSIEIPMQKRNVRMCATRKRWWGDPGYRVSHVSMAWQPRVVHETNGNGANTGFISYHTTFIHGGRLDGIPLKCVFSGRNEFDGK